MSFADLGRILHDRCGVHPSDKLVLGFSGGPDSLALLHALAALKQPTVAAHFDHALRPESASEARQAEQLAASCNVPFVTERGDVGVYAKKHGLSIEEAARELRYAFLFRIAAEQGAAAVAVAHHADDQAETVLMHLLRGAGAAGLRGMAFRSMPNPWSAETALVRPLLEISRQEILEYCTANNLQPLYDSSNDDAAYFRNRLRHELLPLLESYAPGFKTRLVHSADLLAADHALIETLTEHAWRRCLARRGVGFLQFDRPALSKEPLALQRGVLRRAVAELRPHTRNVDFAAIQRAVDLLQDGLSPAPRDWIAGLYLLVEDEELWIADWEADLPVAWPQASEQAIHLEIPVNIELNAEWWLQISEVQNQNYQDALTNQDKFQAWLDRDQVGEELILRRLKPGDRFQPLGMQERTLKLSDFFINEKVPRRARAAWPLLCKGQEIVWVPGYRLAHPYRLQDRSARALHVQLAR